MCVCGWVGGEVVSFWDAGLRTGWAARGDTEVQEGPSRASIDGVSRKDKKKSPELIMAAAAMRVRGPGLIRHVYSRFCTRHSFWRDKSEGRGGGGIGGREGGRRREGPHPRLASRCPCSKLPMPSPSAGGWVWGRGLIVCTKPPKNRPALATVFWNPPLTTTSIFSAGLYCTRPFPGLKVGELSRAGLCGARSGRE